MSAIITRSKNRNVDVAERPRQLSALGFDLFAHPCEYKFALRDEDDIEEIEFNVLDRHSDLRPEHSSPLNEATGGTLASNTVRQFTLRVYHNVGGANPHDCGYRHISIDCANR